MTDDAGIPDDGREDHEDPARSAVLVRFIEAMPAAFCLLDAEGRLRYVNAEAEAILGRPRARLLGATLAEGLPDLAEAVGAACSAAVVSGAPVSTDLIRPGADGGWLQVHAWAGPGGPAFSLLDVTTRYRAEDALRRRTEQAALLTRVRAELSGAADPETALSRLARMVVPVLTDACIVTVLDPDGRARDVGSWHADPMLRETLARYTEVRLDTLPGRSPVARALAAGTSAVEPADAVLALMPDGPARSLLLALAPESVVVLPQRADGRPVGVLTLYLSAGRTLDGDELATARSVAEQAGRAVARAHRRSQQQLLAEALQRSLLTAPPDLGAIEVAVRYVPAEEAARIGGDWYDAFRSRDDCSVLVIGDVVGHDTAAAAAMGQLRGVLRGIVHQSGGRPAQVLHWLDEAMAAMYPETMATAALARLEPWEDGRPGYRLRWANAGHPPPLQLDPDGSVTVLGGTNGDLLLGVDPSSERTEFVREVAPGSTLVFYTDGLVERRDSTLDDGSSRLADAVRELGGLGPEEFCDALLRRLVPASPGDDVALLVVRVTEPRTLAR